MPLLGEIGSFASGRQRDVNGRRLGLDASSSAIRSLCGQPS
jgi:hypothetical protein